MHQSCSLYPPHSDWRNFFWINICFPTSNSFPRSRGGKTCHSFLIVCEHAYTNELISPSPPSDWRNFLDVVVTGIDTSALREVDSVSLVSVSSNRSYGNLRLATRTPRRNTYIRLNASMPEEPFVVVYTAKDDQGELKQAEIWSQFLLSYLLSSLKIMVTWESNSWSFFSYLGTIQPVH